MTESSHITTADAPVVIEPRTTDPAPDIPEVLTNDIAAANKALLRRFYNDVYVDRNMALVDEVVSPQFTSHDWPHGARTNTENSRKS